jgi:hypothetical protein
MLTEPTEVFRARRTSRATGCKAMTKAVATDPDLRIVDAAFADLETTALRSVNPAGSIETNYKSPSYQALARQLSAQLRSLDEQRQRLVKLLHDLRSSPPIEG